MLVDNIRKLCEEHGTTLCGLERTLGIGNGVIGKWARRSPRIGSLQKVADYFHCTVDELLRTDEMRKEDV